MSKRNRFFSLSTLMVCLLAVPSGSAAEKLNYLFTFYAFPENQERPSGDLRNLTSAVEELLKQEFESTSSEIPVTIEVKSRAPGKNETSEALKSAFDEHLPAVVLVQGDLTDSLIEAINAKPPLIVFLLNTNNAHRAGLSGDIKRIVHVYGRENRNAADIEPPDEKRIFNISVSGLNLVSLGGDDMGVSMLDFTSRLVSRALSGLIKTGDLKYAQQPSPVQN